MINHKVYRSDSAGKAEFVKEVISQLLICADTGWFGAEYDRNEYGEYVYLLTENGARSMAIDISRDSLQAIVYDVFKCVRYPQSNYEFETKTDSISDYEIIENFLQREARDFKPVAIAMRNIRKSCRISIKELSALVNIPISTISMYERGNRNPSQEKLEKIMTALKAIYKN